MNPTITNLDRCIEHLKWSVRKMETAVVTSFSGRVPQGHQHSLRMEFSCTIHWVALRVYVAPFADILDQDRTALLEYLNILNGRCRLFKFFLRDRWIVLQHDLSAASLNAEMLEMSTKTLLRIAFKEFFDLNTLAGSQCLSSLMLDLTNTAKRKDKEAPDLNFEIAANPIDPVTSTSHET